jgi:hypothetical protein
VIDQTFEGRIDQLEREDQTNGKRDGGYPNQARSQN